MLKADHVGHFLIEVYAGDGLLQVPEVILQDNLILRHANGFLGSHADVGNNGIEGVADGGLLIFRRRVAQSGKFPGIVSLALDSFPCTGPDQALVFCD